MAQEWFDKVAWMRHVGATSATWSIDVQEPVLVSVTLGHEPQPAPEPEPEIAMSPEERAELEQKMETQMRRLRLLAASSGLRRRPVPNE